MPGDEKFKKIDSESESESDDDEIDVVPTVEVDPSKLTPLSPEVISKQVR
jgi:translation initiation factor 2 subunit 3